VWIVPRTTLDSSGRLAIPKKALRAAGLKTGALLDVQCQDGRIEIEPAPIKVRFVRRGRFVVAQAKHRPREPLTAETVEVSLEALRQERGT
jgi:bifunctional DNA-binding transcriptional regulator/antitoxin component of YhaV-PrlF toxin-antitoxin module